MGGIALSYSIPYSARSSNVDPLDPFVPNSVASKPLVVAYLLSPIETYRFPLSLGQCPYTQARPGSKPVPNTRSPWVKARTSVRAVCTPNAVLSPHERRRTTSYSQNQKKNTQDVCRPWKLLTKSYRITTMSGFHRIHLRHNLTSLLGRCP